MDDPSADAGASPRSDGPSSRLPWRYAEIGRRRLAAIAAGRSAGAKDRKSGRNAVDIDDHIRLAVREETAATLGRAGRKLQEAAAALAAFPAVGCDRDDGKRHLLLQEAALALWEYVVQREAMGLTNHDLVNQVYGVTPELWRRIGSAETFAGSQQGEAGPRRGADRL